MIRIRTGSRLHFGLLSLAATEALWLDSTGAPSLPARRFGGVGLMVEAPGVQLSLAEAPSWSAAGPLADRALHVARRFAEMMADQAVCPTPGRPLAPQQLVVEQAAPEHSGLGTGTQLGLAVAAGLAAAWGLSLDALALARGVGRGLRSSLGLHGFAQGGFLVEAGKRGPNETAPLVARVAFPEDWRVVLVLPPGPPGLHGSPEVQAFDRLSEQGLGLACTDTLCRLVLLGMLPALQEHDADGFGEALYDFNRRVGEAFASVQGGVYASDTVAQLVTWLRQQKVRGAGQSSWGPAVFGVVPDPDRAQQLVSALQARFGLGPGEVFAARACNQGASRQVPREEGNSDPP
jgi:beta-ribofuranosylaminobenzene 5'-phosphate synthase